MRGWGSCVRRRVWDPPAAFVLCVLGEGGGEGGREKRGRDERAGGAVWVIKNSPRSRPFPLAPHNTHAPFSPTPAEKKQESRTQAPHSNARACPSSKKTRTHNSQPNSPPPRLSPARACWLAPAATSSQPLFPSTATASPRSGPCQVRRGARSCKRSASAAGRRRRRPPPPAGAHAIEKAPRARALFADATLPTPSSSPPQKNTKKIHSPRRYHPRDQDEHREDQGRQPGRRPRWRRDDAVRSRSAKAAAAGARACVS